MVVRHIEFKLKDDLTSLGEEEDFEMDTEKYCLQELLEYLYDNMDNFFDKVKITKIWYEKER